MAEKEDSIYDVAGEVVAEDSEIVAEDNAPQEVSEQTADQVQSDEVVVEQKRKGFNPALVISTVVVVLFVLWFCPWAIMRARVTQNEAAAFSVLADPAEKYRLLNMKPEKISRLLKQEKYKGDIADLKLVGLNFIGAKSITKQNNMAICLTPKYYGRTADRTFYLIDGKVYAKDLGRQITNKEIPTPDKTWEAVAVVK